MTNGIINNLLNSLHVWLEEVGKTTSKGGKSVRERVSFDTGVMRQYMSEQLSQFRDKLGLDIVSDDLMGD